MSRRPHSSETRSHTLEDYSVGGDSRTCTVSTDSVGQSRKKKFASPRCYCRSYAIIFQSCTKLNLYRLFLGCPNYNKSQAHCKYFYWLDTLVEENIEKGSSGKNTIFMRNRLKELEKRVMELEMELKIKLKNDVRGIQDNKCLRFAIVGLISILLMLAIKGMF
ncbi:hypothetical protein PIB30_029214 [Stylosanthes scabra]|uniref:Zinc finger GRF-type domain-containing protein n=1 Tax=Stylosanthes scabra TaxID=79078 RepID=A0ABU6RBG0_9FABA|nr:hypothetical protein [Stylosanthes scabra]